MKMYLFALVVSYNVLTVQPLDQSKTNHVSC